MYLTATRQAGNNLFALLAGPSRSRSDHTHHVVLVRRSGMHVAPVGAYSPQRYDMWGAYVYHIRYVLFLEEDSRSSGHLYWTKWSSASGAQPSPPPRRLQAPALVRASDEDGGKVGSGRGCVGVEYMGGATASPAFVGLPRHHYTRSRGNRRHRNQNRDCAGPITPSIPSAGRHRNQNRDCAGPITCRLY